MIGYVPIALSIVAGICVGVGALHLLSGLGRQPSRVHLMFALMCFLIAGNALAGLITYPATEVPALILGMKLQLTLLYLFGLAFLWFTAYYTGVIPVRFLAALSGLIALILVVHLFSPFGILHADVDGLTFVWLPWGERYAFPEATASPWRIVTNLALILTVAYVAYACFQQYQRGDRRAALFLGLSMAVFLGAAIHDGLIDLAVLSSIYLIEYAFLALVALMTVGLSREVNDARIIKQDLIESEARFRRLFEEEIAVRELAESDIRQRNQELLTLQVAGAAIASSLDIEQILDKVTSQMIKLTNVDGCTISDWDQNRNIVVAMTESLSEYWYDKEASSQEYSLADYPLTKRVLTEQLIVQISVSQADADPAELALMKRSGIKTLLMLPLTYKGSVLGLVELADSHRERTFTDREISLVRLLANQAAGAIQNARLYQEAQQEIQVRAEAERSLRESRQFLGSILDSLAAHIAILDESGTILSVNESWRRFGDENGFSWADYGVGRSYLGALAPSAGTEAEGGREAAKGIQEVLAGQRDGFWYEYACHSATEERWFMMGVTRFQSDSGARAVVAHTNITERRQIEEALRESQSRLAGILDSAMDAIITIDAEQEIVLFNPSAEEMFNVAAEEVIGHSLNRFIPSEFRQQHPELIDSFGVGDISSRRMGNARAVWGVKASGEEFPLEVSISQIDVAGQKYYTAIVRDVTPRKQAEEALHRRLDQLSTLNQIAQTVSTVTELPAALEIVAKMVTSLLGASAAVVSVREEHQLKVLAQYAEMGLFSEIVGQRFPLANAPIFSEILNGGRSVVLPDAQTTPLPGSVHARLRALNVQVMMLVPLRARGTVIGILAVGSDRAGRIFSPEEVKLVETIAGHIAGAVENARLFEQAHVVAVDAERQRLARELHDSVTQSLYSLTLLANGWGALAKQGRLVDTAGSFERLGDVGQQALKEMRLLIHQLRPPILEEVGLVGALQQRLDAVEQRVSMDTRLLTRGDIDDLPQSVEEQFFHIAQEALNNALRHADASAITVRVLAENGDLSLLVEDNGVGFDPTSDSTGLGLVTMRERAAAIGGHLLIDTVPDRGTTVAVTVSIDSEGQV